jgi:hypothetical protein
VGPGGSRPEGEARYRAPSGEFASVELDDAEVDTDVLP